MSAKYLATNDEDYLWSALLFPYAGLMFDFLDGKVARWRNESSMLGQELDSLADLVRLSFLLLEQLCLNLPHHRYPLGLHLLYLRL